MRHIFSNDPFAAPVPITALALGMAVPAAARLLITAPRRSQRFASGKHAALCPAVLLARSQREQMSTWRRHRAHTNTRASSIAPPGEEGWTIRDHRAILTSEPYASADLGAASDADRQVFTVRGCAGLFARCDLTPTPQRRHPLSTKRRRPLIGNIGSGGKLPGPSALRSGALAPQHRERRSARTTDLETSRFGARWSRTTRWGYLQRRSLEIFPQCWRPRH